MGEELRLERLILSRRGSRTPQSRSFGFFVCGDSSLNDLRYMQRALDLAVKGRGHVSPNPLVGAVIVRDNHVIGEGWHQHYGGPHAEINAIDSAGGPAECKGADLFLTLEPCSHYGKTPPCVEAVIEAGFRRVVVASVDPNPEVNGRSISMMMNAGIKVDVGLYEDKSRRMNEIFFKYITTRMPFVLLKAAITVDCKIADANGHSNWITGEQSRAYVHKLRSHYDAVVIGGETARIDNPHLTVRHIEGRDPYRIVLHDAKYLDKNLCLFRKNDDNRTIIAVPPQKADFYKDHNAIIWEIEPYEDGGISLPRLLMKAGREKISSILLEGGSRLFSAFMKRKFVDKIMIGISPKILGTGLLAFNDLGIDSLSHAIEIRDPSYKRRGDDIWVTGYPIWI